MSTEIMVHLQALENLLDAEIERIRQTYDPPAWWEWRRKLWVDAVETTRAVSESRLWPMKSKIIELRQVLSEVKTDESKTLRDLLDKIHLLALEVHEGYETSCQAKVNTIYSLSNYSLQKILDKVVTLA